MMRLKDVENRRFRPFRTARGGADGGAATSNSNDGDGGGGRWLALHAGQSLELLQDARLVAGLRAFCPDLMRCPGRPCPERARPFAPSDRFALSGRVYVSSHSPIGPGHIPGPSRA